MSARPHPIQLDLARVIALSGAVAFVRVVFAEAADGFAAHGLFSLSASAASVRFVEGTVVAFVALLIVRAWHRARPDAWAPAIATAAFVFVFLTLRWPALPLESPGWSGAKALSAEVLAFVLALVTARLLVREARLPPRAERVLVRATFLLFVAAGVLRVVEHRARRATPDRPNVIVISIDGVRADRLGCAGWMRPTTPNLDAFARRAVRFENAYSPTPATLAGQASLLTGLLPAEHQVGPLSALSERAPALAAELGARGFDTFALVDGTPWMHERFGLSRGFGWWRAVSGGADAKLDALEPVLDVIGARRAFVFIELADACADTRRVPYASDPEDQRACVPLYANTWILCDDQARCGAEWLLARSREPGGTPDAATIEHVSALYDAGLRSLDRRLGRLFHDLERRGLLDDSLVVVTSCHAEAFFEHQKFLHLDAYRECTHVPLIVRPPGGTAERSVEPAVSIADVAPTILEWIGADAARPTSTSLAGCVRGGAADRLPDLARVDFGAAEAAPQGASVDRGVRSARASLLALDGSTRMFDLTQDPAEQRPIDGSVSADMIRLARAFPWTVPAPPFGAGVPLAPFDDEVRGRLERAGEPDPTAALPATRAPRR